MNRLLKQQILAATGASSIIASHRLQSLWSGYGELLQMTLANAHWPAVVVKWVSPPEQVKHPKGWHGDLGHQRKLQSYEVEWHWYQNYAASCQPVARLPAYIYCSQTDNQRLLVMEDLSAEFPMLLDVATVAQLQPVLSWLARFHAHFLQDEGIGLWPQGCYWHLQTRPEEWQRMPAGKLKDYASELDQHLQSAQFKTLVHGDAKLANFCFSEDYSAVAAVDFQYVGAGCGIRDVMYLLTSALSESVCREYEDALLDFYFERLEGALMYENKGHLFPALVEEWRTLYDIAWADFHRFLAGWSPEHWKINSQMQEKTDRVLAQWTS